jgi:hypothetical protein
VVFIKAGQMSYFDNGRSEAVTIPVATASAIGVRAWLRNFWIRLPPALAPPGWYSDPIGRHVYRYWDGSMWTEYVSPGNGVRFTDPLK